MVLITVAILLILYLLVGICRHLDAIAQRPKAAQIDRPVWAPPDDSPVRVNLSFQWKEAMLSFGLLLLLLVVGIGGLALVVSLRG